MSNSCRAVDVYVSNYPWTLKPWKMKVVGSHANYAVYPLKKMYIGIHSVRSWILFLVSFIHLETWNSWATTKKNEWSQSHEILQWVNGETPISWKTILYISYWSVAIKRRVGCDFPVYNPNISNSTKGKIGGISEGEMRTHVRQESLHLIGMEWTRSTSTPWKSSWCLSGSHETSDLGYWSNPSPQRSSRSMIGTSPPTSIPPKKTETHNNTNIFGHIHANEEISTFKFVFRKLTIFYSKKLRKKTGTPFFHWD